MISPRNPKWANAPRAPAPRGEENLSDDTNPGIITPTRDIENSRLDRTNQSDFEPQNNPSVYIQNNQTQLTQIDGTTSIIDISKVTESDLEEIDFKRLK